MPDNKLYYGDNLDILRNREYFPNACVDLIYLDPPFNSNRNYNVLFKDESGKQSDAQITAFEDTWHWGRTAEATYHELVTDAPERVAATIGALRTIVGTNQVMAYLVMMAARLVELHRVLKPTGSLYLHCDPTASHYLKVILDAIFGADHFQNELIWRRTGAHGSAKRYGPIHDVMLFYTKGKNFSWNGVYLEYDEEYKKRFSYSDVDGRKFQPISLIAEGTRNGSSGMPWRGIDVSSKGNHWRYTTEKLDELDAEGRIYWPEGGGLPRLKFYLDESKGAPIQDLWTDIPPVNSQARERLDYPTQKPVALLERIVQASSNPGDVVLDPFCGCGTAIAAAQKLGRRWVGIDITHLSIALQKYRLKDMFGLEEKRDYTVIGEPEDIGAARQLAADDRYQFQWWALSLVKAKPLGGESGSKQGKKGSDRGIDGVINFIDDSTGKPKRILVQVKSGHVKSGDVRDLKGTVEREGAAMGLFITLEAPTREMTTEAVSAGFYHSPGWGRDYPKIQLLTITDLLAGKMPDMPPAHGTFKQAAREKGGNGEQQLGLFEE